MKKLLLLMAISLSTQAQIQYAVHVVRITPDTACMGDSIKIDLKVVNPGLATPSISIQLLDQGNINIMLYQNYFNTIYSFPKDYYLTQNVQDSAYLIKAKVPLNCNLSVNGYGMGRIYVNGYYMTFGYRSCVTSIKENNFELNETYMYFDLQGNQINKKTNQLIIEQVGLKRKKVFIAD